MATQSQIVVPRARIVKPTTGKRGTRPKTTPVIKPRPNTPEQKKAA